jgi:hypothetical protein
MGNGSWLASPKTLSVGSVVGNQVAMGPISITEGFDKGRGKVCGNVGRWEI